MGSIRITVLDDHPVVRAGICAIISSQPDLEVVGQHGDAAEALSHVAAEMPDVVLMDLRLPGMTGVEAIRHLRLYHSQIRILVLTTYEGDEDIRQAAGRRRRGLHHQGMNYDRLLQGIRRVYAGKTYLPRELSRTVNERPPMTSARVKEKCSP